MGVRGWGRLPLMAGMEPHQVQPDTAPNRALETLSAVGISLLFSF